MSLRLYDTATRSVRDFVPRLPGEVGIYLCGLTVQSPPHIGHLRSAVNYDVLHRWLQHSGFRVTYIRNITDIDDKVLAKSVELGVPFWAVAYANERILSEQYDRLGVLAPTYEPRATGHVPEMHELIAKLIEDGHAYVAEDGSGDVYFDVKTFDSYGALSGQRPDRMQAADDGPERAKRDPRDFALWKGAKADEPAEASWPSPWGRGRPGWHIECSAMCWRYLGAEFDIHGGGLDLVFPHHENEVAQSHAAGLPFARFWVHHGLLNLGEAKMGKSTGNVIDLPSIEATGGTAGGAAVLPGGAALSVGDRLLRGGAARGRVGLAAHRGLRGPGVGARGPRGAGSAVRRVRGGDGRRPEHVEGSGRGA